MQLEINKKIRNFFGFNVHEGINVKKILKDTGWMTYEKVIRIGIAFFITPWITNYLGVADYGRYSYVLAYWNIFIIFVELGIGNAIVKEFIAERVDKDRAFGTLFVIRILGSILALVSMLGIYFIFNRGDHDLLFLILVMSFKFFILSFGVIELYLQSKSKFKTTSVIRNIAYILITVIQIIFILTNAPLIFFGIAFSLESIFVLWGMFSSYRQEGGKLFNWKFDKEYFKYIFKTYYPIILTGAFTILYLRINQVLVGEIIDKETLGIYSITVKLTEIWFFVILSINSILIPILFGKKVTGDKKYDIYMQRMFNIMTWVGISLVIIALISTNLFLKILYDPVYWDAGKYVLIYAFVTIGTAQSVASNTWYLSENLQKYGMYIYCLGFILSLLGGYVLISLYGPYGAAFTTVLTVFLVTNVLPLIFKETRKGAIMLLKSYNPLLVFRDVLTIAKSNFGNK